jgi:hypothetical protein
MSWIVIPSITTWRWRINYWQWQRKSKIFDVLPKSHSNTARIPGAAPSAQPLNHALSVPPRKIQMGEITLEQAERQYELGFTLEADGDNKVILRS